MWQAFIAQFVNRLFWLIEILILAHVILSWIPIPSNRFTEPIKRFIYDVTEPILGLFRSLLPPVMVGDMGLDLSPFVAMLVLELLRSLIMRILSLL